MFRRNRFYLILGFVAYALTFPGAAHAYLDAGTGSYLIQIAVAFIAGGLFMVKVFWHKLWSFFGINKNEASEKTNHHSEEPK